MPTSDPHKILLIRPSALGDVCRTVPLAASLKHAFPNASIDWLVQRGFEPAVSHHPAVNAVIPFPRTELTAKKLLRQPRSRGQLAEMLRRIRPGRRYDITIDAQGLARSGLFTRWSGAPIRIGERHAREQAHLAYTHKVRVPEDAHAVERMLALLEPLAVTPIDDMRLYTPPHAADQAARILPDEPYTVIAPTSRWPGKRWPIERFIDTTHALLDRNTSGARRVVIVASESERPQCNPLLNAFARDPRVTDLVGATDVGQLLATIERAALVIANDSAALHIAVGFDRPIVALFGPTRTSRVGPYHRDADVIQPTPPDAATTHKDEHAGAQLMRNITANRVIEAAIARLTIDTPAPINPASASPSP